MTENKKDPIGLSLLTVLFLLLGLIAIIYYRSIDWDVLKRLEQTPLALPTPIASSTATPSSTTVTPTQTKN